MVCDNNDVKHSNKCPILLGLDIWDAIIMHADKYNNQIIFIFIFYEFLFFFIFFIFSPNNINL